jgi:hypothetical protein
MAKRWTKQKAGQQKGKRRKAKAGSASGGGGGGSDGAAGTMGGFRRFMKAIAGTGKKKGPKSPVEKAIDVILWVAVIVAIGYFLSNKCT